MTAARLPDQIDVPTFDGVHLGPYRQKRNDVEGECGCFKYWEDRLREQIGKSFERVSSRALDRRAAAVGMSWADITPTHTPNTIKRRRIAYNALRKAWQSYGYE